MHRLFEPEGGAPLTAKPSPLPVPAKQPTGLHANGISVSGRESGTKILDDIHIDVALGEAYALCGEDARAKRLLTRLLASGMFPAPAALTGDESLIAGLPLSPDAGYAGDFGRAFSFMTCREYLRYMLGSLRINKRALMMRIDALIKSVGLAALADRKIKRLTDCEYLMLMLALRLFSNPPVIILNADNLVYNRKSAALLWKTVAALKAENKAILVNLGNIAFAGECFDLVGILHNARIAACASGHDLMRRYADSVYSVRTDGNIRKLAAALREMRAGMTVRVKRERLYVTADNSIATGQLLVDALSNENAELLSMQFRLPSLANAYKKVVNGK